MKVDVTVRTERAHRFVQAVFDEQVPFATAVAINESAKHAQGVQRKHQRGIFEVRRPLFVDRSVKIKPFANKRTLTAVVSVDPPGGKDRADVIAQHEEGGPKGATSGTSVAVPTRHVPRTGAGVINRAWRPARLRKTRGGRSRRDKREWGTFIRRTRGGRRAIFFDEGDEGIKPLYWLVPSVPIQPSLNFVENIRGAVLAVYDANFTKALDRAIGSAR